MTLVRRHCTSTRYENTNIPIDAKWWRTNVGLVQQEPFLFNDTIYNNVAHGLSGPKWLDISEEEKRSMVEKACVEAFADDFIQKLPEVCPVLPY